MFETDDGHGSKQIKPVQSQLRLQSFLPPIVVTWPVHQNAGSITERFRDVYRRIRLLSDIDFGPSRHGDEKNVFSSKIILTMTIPCFMAFVRLSVSAPVQFRPWPTSLAWKFLLVPLALLYLDSFGAHKLSDQCFLRPIICGFLMFSSTFGSLRCICGQLICMKWFFFFLCHSPLRLLRLAASSVIHQCLTPIAARRTR